MLEELGGVQMLKLLSAVLALLLAIMPAAAVANQEREAVEHLLWEIPFGISLEECRELVREWAGVELTKTFNTGWGDEYCAYEDQGFTWFDCPASLTAHFDDEKGELTGFSIVILYEERWPNNIPSGVGEVRSKEDPIQSFSMTWEIYRKAGHLFGTPTGGTLSLASLREETAYYYSYPMQSGVLDEAYVEEFFSDVDNHSAAFMFTWYDNVRIAIAAGCTRVESWGTRKPLSISVQYVAKEIVDEKAYTFHHGYEANGQQILEEAD